MHSGLAERLGLVEEGQRRRERYGRFAYRAPAWPPDKPADVDLAAAGIRNRIDKRREEIIAAHIEAEAQREAEAELAKTRAIGDALPRVEALLQLVAEVTNVSVQALKGQRRAREIAWPRQFAMWLIRECRRDLSYPQIGRMMGGRDHTTVMHGLRSVEARQNHPLFAAWRDDWRVQAALSDWAAPP